MIKKIGCLSIMFFLALSINAQKVVTTTTDKVECKKPCTPTKACAEKYGMTLKECKRICEAKNAGTKTAEASTSTETTKVASYEVRKEAAVATEEKVKACDKTKKCCKKSKKEKA